MHDLPPDLAPEPQRSALDETLIGRIVVGLAGAVAFAGGLALVAVIGVVVASVTGRALIWAGLGSIRGDYELVSAGVGFSVFAFLAWAHLTRGHAVVTIFTDMMSTRFNFVIQVISDVLMLAAAWFIAVRLYFGLLDRINFGDTTVLMRMPLWWTYAACMVGAATIAIVSIYVLVRTLVDRTPPAPERAETTTAGAGQ